MSSWGKIGIVWTKRMRCNMIEKIVAMFSKPCIFIFNNMPVLFYLTIAITFFEIPSKFIQVIQLSFNMAWADSEGAGVPPEK